MSIILHENEWAEKMIKSNDLGGKPSETLRRISRYYLDNGLTKIAVRKNVESFILRCNPENSLPNWSKVIERAIKGASEHPALDIEGVDITDSEMKRIDSLDGIQTRRLAFTLLCLAKYQNIVNDGNNGWVNTKDSIIMSMANINASVRKQSLMYWTLREEKMLEFAKRVDNINVRVCFMDNGNTVLSVTDFKSLGYQYMMYHGAPYFKCECCGETVKMKDPKNKRRQKYCSKCAVKIHNQQKEDSANRRKNTNISKNADN